MVTWSRFHGFFSGVFDFPRIYVGRWRSRKRRGPMGQGASEWTGQHCEFERLWPTWMVLRAGEWCGRAERRFRFSFFGQRDVVGGSASKTIRRLQQQNRTEKSASQAAGKGRGAGRFQTRTESRHVALFSRLSGPASQSSYFFYFSAIGPHSLTLSLSLSHSVFLRLTLSLSLLRSVWKRRFTGRLMGLTCISRVSPGSASLLNLNWLWLARTGLRFVGADWNGRRQATWTTHRCSSHLK